MTRRESAHGALGHVAFEELAAGYALHALEPEDELRFQAHLASCAECERALAEHLDTLEQLAEDASATPPPSVLDGIRAAVRGETGSAAVGPAVVPDAAGGKGGSAAEPAVDDELSRARRRRDAVQVPRRLLLSGAAAATTLVLGLGAWAAVLQSDRAEQVARADRLEQTVQALQSQDAQTVQLADLDGQVLAVVIAHGEQMSLIIDGLEPNPEDTVYVLWGQSQSGDVRAVSTFDVAHDGLDVLSGVPLQVDMAGLTTLMVTHEHSRTPPAETSQPVLVAGSV
jgi:hypothetical protein